MSYALQDAVWEIEGLSGTAKFVLMRLAFHARDAADTPYPSIRTLADKTGLSENGVRSGLKELVSKGMIREVGRRGVGAGRTARWLLIIQGVKSRKGSDLNPSDLHPSNVNPSNVNPSDLNPYIDIPYQNAQEISNEGCRSEPEPIRRKKEEKGSKEEPPYTPPLPVVIDVTPEPVVCEAETPSGMSVTVSGKPRRSGKLPVIPGGFEEFYREYPLKKEPLDAERAYSKARKLVSHAEIMEGVLRFQQELASGRADKRYIKHPATWLNKGCWADEPAPADTRRMGRNGRPMDAGAAAFMDMTDQYFQTRNQG